MECVRAVQRIDNKEAAPCAVIGTEEYFYKVHDGRPVALTCKFLVRAKTADEYGRETFQSLVAQVRVVKKLLLVLVGNAVGQTDAIIGE